MKKLEIDYKGETFWLDYNEWLFEAYFREEGYKPSTKRKTFDEWRRR